MTNKCPNCGYQYNSQDIFCARCGKRLKLNAKSDVVRAIERFSAKTTANSKSKKKGEFFNPNANNFFDNAMVGAVIFLLIVALSVSVLLFFVIKKHDNQKDILQYRNYISNPVQIPLLKEPSNYTGFFENLADVEEFLENYLKYSSDSVNKKMQIFSNFVNEMEKVPNILNLKVSNDIVECKDIRGNQACVAHLNKNAKKIGVNVYLNNSTIFLYPDYRFIKKKYYKYLDFDFRQFVSYRNKYSAPVAFDLNLLVSPKILAEKIYDTEKLLKKIQTPFIKDLLEKTIYADFRRFIFTPSIYATTTQEMKAEFKNAYEYFISSKRDSIFRPLVMSYLDKKRAYGEGNFEKDYPLTKIENKNEGHFKISVLDDIFDTLRKNAFLDGNEKMRLSYVYDVKTSLWKRYNSSVALAQGEYVICEPDENNNISIYNHMFSPMQELNIYRYSQLYLINNALYAFNKDKLSLMKVTFNGKIFNLYNLSNSDVTTLFPGVEIINMDTFSNYDILIEKENKQAAYIVISRYSQGWNDYNLKPLKGEINILTLPNMFSVNSNDNVILSFETENKGVEEISENHPSYKFTIKTHSGEKVENLNPDDVQLDDNTKNDDEENAVHKPKIMPKLMEKTESVELEENSMLLAPIQNIEPPKDELD